MVASDVQVAAHASKSHSWIWFYQYQ